MKIKVQSKPYDGVMALPRAPHKYPGRPSFLLHTAMRAGSALDLKAVGFTYEAVNMERAGKGPWLVLMNHSSFLDFEILSRILYPKPYHIVATSDGFVGKEWLMRALGCIPTQKFVRDATLIKDMDHALNTRGECVVLESYSVYSDFYWYELGDVICIGDRDKLFYCFPRQKDVVAKVRLAAEEIYKLKKPASFSKIKP